MVVSVEVQLLKTGIQKTEQDSLLGGLKDLYMTSPDLTYFSHYLFKQNRQFSGFSEQAIWVGVYSGMGVGTSWPNSSVSTAL